jgi:hypothetical protein
MHRRKKVKGKPYTFHEFVFFSPKQFDEPVSIEEKKSLFNLKICINSNRVFTVPFFNECVGEQEATNKELKQMLEVINETPGLIIYGEEYTIYDDCNGLWKYYGRQEETPLAHIVAEELI